MLVISSPMTIQALNNPIHIERSTYGNVPPIEWNTSFSSPGDSEGFHVQQTVDGGYIIVGYTTIIDEYKADVWLIRTDDRGNKQWDRTFGGDGSDYGETVLQTPDGGFIIVGATASYGAGGFDVWFIKTDANGHIQWDKTFGGKSYDYGEFFQSTDDGGYIIVGVTRSFSSGGRDIWLVKIDANGKKQWDTCFGGEEDEEGYSVQQTADGGYILTGWTKSYGTGYSDILVVKTDASGKEQWTRVFGGENSDIGRSVLQTDDGNYIIAGYTWSPVHEDFDVWLIKLNSQGEKMWDKVFATDNTEKAYCVQETYDGGYIIVGYQHGLLFNEFIWLLKTDSDGEMEWSYRPGYDIGYYIQETRDGGYIITGSNDRYNPDVNYSIREVVLYKISGSEPPHKPERPSGPEKGVPGTSYSYTSSTIDPDGDELFYNFSWSDGNYSGWLGPYPSGESVSTAYIWENTGIYSVKVKAKDIFNLESYWSDPLTVRMPKNKPYLNTPFIRFLEQHPHLFPLLRQLLELL